MSPAAPLLPGLPDTAPRVFAEPGADQAEAGVTTAKGVPRRGHISMPLARWAGPRAG